MSVKPDSWIRETAVKHGMIEPFSEKQVSRNVISYGLSSYGYDMRIADEFKIFTKPETKKTIDPKNFDAKYFRDFKGNRCAVPPNSFVLARSLEYFRIPRNIITLCFGKSTYARCGLVVNVTPFEPEWEGFATISISNTAPLEAVLYAFEGVAQIVFLESDRECETSYRDKKGKYQKQESITTAKMNI